MYTKEEKNTTRLPLLGWQIEDKIYIHPESGDKVNLGPLFEVLIEYGHDDTAGADLEFQKAIKFLNDCAYIIPDDEFQIYKKGYDLTMHLLYRLKDSLALLQTPEPTPQECIEVLEKQVGELKQRLS